MTAHDPPGRAASPLRVVVAGAGLIGRRHVDLVGAHPDCELAAIADPAPAAAELAAGLGVAVHDQLVAALAVHAPHAVIVSSPTNRHRDDGLACVEAGVPALVEKPLADAEAEAEELVAAAEAASVPLLVGHHRRHSPVLAAAADLIASGRLGTVVAVQGAALFYKPDAYFEAAPWRRHSGGGPILINLVHEIDALRALCGEIVTVQATASRRTRRWEVEDTVAVTLELASGALATFLLSDVAAAARSWEHNSGEDPAFPQTEGDCYLIAGTRGSLGVPSLRLQRYEGERSWREPLTTSVIDVAGDADPLALQLDHFVEVARGRMAPLVDGREALQTLRVTNAIARAAVSGCREVVAPPSAPAR